MPWYPPSGSTLPAAGPGAPVHEIGTMTNDGSSARYELTLLHERSAGTFARVYLAEARSAGGIDRIVAVAEDGRGWVWHQINRCGEVVFDGQPAPEDCPEPPDRY